MIEIQIKNNQFIVEDSGNIQLCQEKGYGKYNTSNNYILNEFETFYLLEKKKAKVEKNKENVSKETFEKKFPFSRTKYAVYKDLRDKGYRVGTALKYGFAFRVYDKGIKEGEDHSLWLVEAIDEETFLEAKDFTGKNRLAHSTRKRVLLAIVDKEEDISYFETIWKRM